MPGNSQRKGAVRRERQRQHSRFRWTDPTGPGRKRADAQGRGPALPRRLPRKENQQQTRRPGRGAAPKTGRPGSGPEWVVGRNAVLEAMEAEIPIRSAYVAEGAERDDRLRDILKRAATRGTSLLEVTRSELDRLTGGALHQGVALQLPAFDYRAPGRSAEPPPWIPTGRHSSSHSTRLPIRATWGQLSGRPPHSARTASSSRNAGRPA